MWGKKVGKRLAEGDRWLLLYGRISAVHRNGIYAISSEGKNKNNNSVCESTFLEIYLFKNCPEGKICGKFLKKAKMYFIEGRS